MMQIKSLKNNWVVLKQWKRKSSVLKSVAQGKVEGDVPGSLCEKDPKALVDPQGQN